MGDKAILEQENYLIFLDWGMGSQEVLLGKERKLWG